MFRVLQHYLPIRTALLVFSETILLTAVLVAFVYAARGLSERAGSRLSERRSEDSTPSLLAVERAEQQAELRGYRWIDRSEGRVAIPIERAMELFDRMNISSTRRRTLNRPPPAAAVAVATRVPPTDRGGRPPRPTRLHSTRPSNNMARSTRATCSHTSSAGQTITAAVRAGFSCARAFSFLR